ncbi:QsdR family transcriptional regulator [Zhongshania sp.]|uniref:QsdR family transcriptional regulator n=1 Tax=Zhongshania sp. TaxID=1971902 RepID=UPI003562D1AE
MPAIKDINYKALVDPTKPHPFPEIPDEIFFYAVDKVLSEKRVDLTQMAADLGVSRVTIHRKVRRRDDLLGAAMLYVFTFMLDLALEAGNGKAGVERIGAISHRLFELVRTSNALHFLLSNEPECALRLLTTKKGPIQGYMVAGVELMLAEEVDNGTLAPRMPVHSLAYLLVRVGESFMYADVIADEPVDIEQAYECVMGILKSQAT